MISATRCSGTARTSSYVARRFAGSAMGASHMLRRLPGAVKPIFAASAEVRRSSNERAVERNIAIGHVIDGEPRQNRRAASGAIDLVDARDGQDGVVEVVDEKTSDAMIDQLGHGTATVGDHRSTAGHRLDHRKTEWFVEMDEMEQRAGRAERSRAGRATDR